MKRLATSAVIALLAVAAPGIAQESPKEPAEPQITLRGAKSEAEAKARLRADALLARCQYKPVMTDEEIAQCAEAQRASVEAARGAAGSVPGPGRRK